MSIFCVFSQESNTNATSNYSSKLFLANVQSSIMYSDNPDELIDSLNQLIAIVKYDNDIPYLIISYDYLIKDVDVTLYSYDGHMMESIIKATVGDITKALKVRISSNYVPFGTEILRVEVNGLTHYYTFHYN